MYTVNVCKCFWKRFGAGDRLSMQDYWAVTHPITTVHFQENGTMQLVKRSNVFREGNRAREKIRFLKGSK